MDTILLALVLGTLIGLALGALGGGGSILTVPALVYLLGQDAHAAVGTSLVIVGANAAFGAYMHGRRGALRLREALIFGGAGIVAAYGGARLSSRLPPALLLALFALLMVLIAVVMLRGRAQQPEAGRATLGSGGRAWPRVIAGGLGVGFLTGFLGVGGGFLIVPALVLLLGMEMQAAVGSSLLVIALNSAAGLLGHLGDVPLNWGLIGLLVAGGLAGIAGGAWLAQRVPPARLRQAFALLVLILGGVLLALNLPLVPT